MTPASAARRAHTSSIARDESTPITRIPSAPSGTAIRPVPTPSSTTGPPERRASYHEDAAGELLPEEGGEPESGSKEPGKVKAGTFRATRCARSPTAKMKDLNANDVEAAMRMVEGSARSMGLEVVG